MYCSSINCAHHFQHMNDDHADSTVAIVKHYVGVPCSEANIVSIDRLGMTVKAKIDIMGGQDAKIRVPFTRPAENRKDIKERLVSKKYSFTGDNDFSRYNGCCVIFVNNGHIELG